MKQLLLRNLKQSKWSSILFALALLVIFILLPISLHSLKDIREQTETNVVQHARGSYDILIRPNGAIHPLEKERGIVPENYIGFGDGGISIEDWEDIKNHPEVEIAAPVASLGYFTGLTNLYVYTPPEQSSRITSRLYTTDGVNRYPVSKEYACTLLEYKESTDPTIDDRFDTLFNDEALLNLCTNATGYTYFRLPISYHLVAAIDPLQEEALTGISFSEIEDDATSSGWGDIYNRDFGFNTERVPLMELLDQNVTLEVDSFVETLGTTREDVLELRDKYGVTLSPEKVTLSDGTTTETPTWLQELYFHEDERYDQLLNEIRNIPVLDKKEFTVDIGSLLKPFLQDYPPVITPEGSVRLATDNQEDWGIWMEYNMQDSTIYYTAGHLDYDQKGNELSISIVEKDENGVPIYREIQKNGTDMKSLVDDGKSPPFIFDPVGQFSVNDYEAKLSSSPLGIYQMAPAYYIGDGEQDPIKLEATISPGSFITPPASGVVNIKYAEVIKGEKPIDAIRVKVAGISDYSPSAAQKIETLANEFKEKGFNVSIVAGSSPQYVNVDVEGVGLIRESWTTLGAAASIIMQWDMTSLLLGISFILVVIFYVNSRMRFWQVTNETDVKLFFDLGWDRRNQLHLYRSEIMIVLLSSILFSIPILISLQILYDLEPVIYVYYIITILLIFVIYMGLISINLKRSYFIKGKNSKLWIPSKSSLVLRSLVYYRKYITSPFLQILLVSALVPLVILSLFETAEQTRITLLGDYIHLQINHIHVLLIVGTVILTIFTLFESLTSLFLVRNQELELYHDIGWNNKEITSLFLKETSTWLGVAILFGSTLGLILYLSFYTFNLSSVVVLLSSFISINITTQIITRIIIKRII